MKKRSREINNSPIAKMKRKATKRRNAQNKLQEKRNSQQYLEFEHASNVRLLSQKATKRSVEVLMPAIAMESLPKKRQKIAVKIQSKQAAEIIAQLPNSKLRYIKQVAKAVNLPLSSKGKAFNKSILLSTVTSWFNEPSNIDDSAPLLTLTS